MSELSDELRTTIDGAAAPVSFNEIIGRAPERRRRSPRRVVITAVVAVVALLVAAVVVTRIADGGSSSGLRVAAPTVAVGDIDLAVLATTFDQDGARGPVAPELVDTVRGISGVSAADGAMQRFVEVVPTMGTAPTLPASARSAIAISWEDGAPLDFATGGPPAGRGDVAINQSLAEQYGIGVGAEVSVSNGPSPSMGGGPAAPMHVVGVFTPAGGDVEDINLVVLGADDLAAVSGRDTFDRIDIVAAAGAPIEDLLDRVTAALPAGFIVVPPSVVGFDSKLRAELEIQRAYHWLIDIDLAKRQQAIDVPPTDPAETAANGKSWNDHLSEIVNVEFRVSRVAFVDSAMALVTFRTYYMGRPSPVAANVMTGVVVNVDGMWRISQRGICELARNGNTPCNPGDGPDPASLVPPPDGWDRPDAVVAAADAFRVLADPASTTDQRVAVIENGEALRRVIAAGAASDAARPGPVDFRIAGTRLLDATHAQVLYSVIAAGEPHLETPYPIVGSAVLVDGTWRIRSRFACGLAALAATTCPAVPATPTTTSPAPTTTVPEPTTSVPSTTVPATTTIPETATTIVVPTTGAP